MNRGLALRAWPPAWQAWMGSAAVKRDLTDKMRDAQKKEVLETLETALAGGEGRRTPTRYLRKDAARLQAAAAAAAAAGGGAAAGGPVVVGAPGGAAGILSALPDGWEMCEPEDILPRLGKKENAETPTFWDGATSANWKERHTAFSDLRQACLGFGCALGISCLSLVCCVSAASHS